MKVGGVPKFRFLFRVFDSINPEISETFWNSKFLNKNAVGSFDQLYLGGSRVPVFGYLWEMALVMQMSRNHN